MSTEVTQPHAGSIVFYIPPRVGCHITALRPITETVGRTWCVWYRDITDDGQRCHEAEAQSDGEQQRRGGDIRTAGAAAAEQRLEDVDGGRRTTAGRQQSTTTESRQHGPADCHRSTVIAGTGCSPIERRPEAAGRQAAPDGSGHGMLSDGV